MEISAPRKPRNYGTIGSDVGFITTARNSPIKILISDKDGQLVPCNYQKWGFACDNGVGGGNRYVAAGDPVNETTLIDYGGQTFRSDSYEGTDFHEFIASLMDSPHPWTKYIRHLATRRIEKRESVYFCGIKIWTRKKVFFDHEIRFFSANSS